MTLLHGSKFKDAGEHSREFRCVLRRLDTRSATRWGLKGIEREPAVAKINDLDA
jgi:hypothetical protein